ncbi:10759_t:CDS:2, partial [Racocetra persica]
MPMIGKKKDKEETEAEQNKGKNKETKGYKKVSRCCNLNVKEKMKIKNEPK